MKHPAINCFEDCKISPTHYDNWKTEEPCEDCECRQETWDLYEEARGSLDDFVNLLNRINKAEDLYLDKNISKGEGYLSELLWQIERGIS